jgi:hypothetical protein
MNVRAERFVLQTWLPACLLKTQPEGEHLKLRLRRLERPVMVFSSTTSSDSFAMSLT